MDGASNMSAKYLVCRQELVLNILRLLIFIALATP